MKKEGLSAALARISPKPAKNNQLGFFRRYWSLILCFAVCVALYLSNVVFGVFGVLICLPMLVIFAFLLVLWLRHTFFRNTLDEDVHSGLFVKTWIEELSPRERVYANLAVLGVLFVGICLIAAALIGKS